MDLVSAVTVLVWAIEAVKKGCEIYNRIKGASEKIDKVRQEIYDSLSRLKQIREGLLPVIKLEREERKRVQGFLKNIQEASDEVTAILNLWDSTQGTTIRKAIFKFGWNRDRLEDLAGEIQKNVDKIEGDFNRVAGKFVLTTVMAIHTTVAPGTHPSQPPGTLPSAGPQPTTLPAPCHGQYNPPPFYNQQQNPSHPAFQPQYAVPGLPNGFGSVPGNCGKPGSTSFPGVPTTSFGQPQPHPPSAYAPLNNLQPNYQSFTPPRPPVIPPSFPHPGAALPHQQSSASQNTPSQVHQPPHAGPSLIQPNLPVYPQPPAPISFAAPRPPPPPTGSMSFPPLGNHTGFAAAQPAPPTRMPQSFTQAPTNLTPPQPPAGQMPQGIFHHSARMPPQPQPHQYQPPQPQAQTRPYQAPAQPAPQPQVPHWNGHVPTPPAASRPENHQQTQYPNKPLVGGVFLLQPQPPNHLPQHGVAGISQHRTGPPACPAPGMGNMEYQTPHAQTTTHHNLRNQAIAGGIPGPGKPYTNNIPVGAGQPHHPVPINCPQPGPAAIPQHNSGPAHVAGGMPNAQTTANRPANTDWQQQMPVSGNLKMQMHIKDAVITWT